MAEHGKIMVKGFDPSACIDGATKIIPEIVAAAQKQDWNNMVQLIMQAVKGCLPSPQVQAALESKLNDNEFMMGSVILATMENPTCPSCRPRMLGGVSDCVNGVKGLVGNMLNAVKSRNWSWLGSLAGQAPGAARSCGLLNSTCVAGIIAVAPLLVNAARTRSVGDAVKLAPQVAGL